MSDREKSCCFTGYRPAKFSFVFKPNNKDYFDFENRLTEEIFKLANENVRTFYCGAAMGFDILAGEIVLLLKKSRKKDNIRLVCVLPFIDQAQNFPEDWAKRYKKLLASADETVLTSDGYFTGCYQKRNEYMVDRSDVVVTWFDGCPGGTKNTLYYAHRKGVEIHNLSKIKEETYENLLYYETVDED